MCTCTLLLYRRHQLLSGHWTECWECPSAPPLSLPLGLAYPKFGQLASSLMLSAVVSLLWENWRVCRTGRQPTSGEHRDRRGSTRRGHTICSPCLPHCCTRPLHGVVTQYAAPASPTAAHAPYTEWSHNMQPLPPPLLHTPLTRRGRTICSPCLPHCCTRPLHDVVTQYAAPASPTAAHAPYTAWSHNMQPLPPPPLHTPLTRCGHTICSPCLPHCCTRPLRRHSLRFSSTETMLWLRLRVSSSCNGSKFSIFLMRFW